MKMFDYLHLDKYDREAVIPPAIFTTILMIGASWQLVDYVSFFRNINISSAVLLAAIFSVTVIWYHIVRLVGKNLIEPIMFGNKRQKFPTTRFLLLNEDFGDKILAEKVRLKIEKDFHMYLKSKTQEKNNPAAARNVIEAAVKLIKKAVQASQNDMYLRKNIRYGLYRNTTGGCVLAIFVESAIALYSLVCGHPFMIGWVTMAVSLVLVILFSKFTKDAANEYASELFETYLSIV